MSLVIIDYGLCNLLSVFNALKIIGVEAVVSTDPSALRDADRVILPGVGAFADGMKGLKERGFIEPIHDFVRTGRPFLGICLGMQFLMDKSYEFGEHKGLGLVPGEVLSLKEGMKENKSFKVPHIGWNHLWQKENPWSDTILSGLSDGTQMYFVHSFYTELREAKHALAMTDYEGKQFCSVLAKDNVYGCQFHPEKSSGDGLKILNNFIHL